MSTDASAVALYVGIAIVAVVVLLGLWVQRKGRLQTGAHVFRASRFSRGNRLFPSQVILSPSSITLFKPQWIGKLEESIHLTHVASIKIDTNVLFADVYIESTGGHNPIVCYGHTKGDAIKIKALIEELQGGFYKKQ